MNRRNSFSWKRLLKSPVTLIIILVIFVVLARAAWTMVSRSRLSAERLSQAQAQYAKLEQSQTRLSEEVMELSSPGGIEADLREKYHAVTPGESVAVIVDSPSGNDSSADQSASALNASSTAPVGDWWQRLLEFFGL
jgi:cell division protein FtsB